MHLGTYIYNYYALVLNVKNIIKNVHKEMVVIFNFKVIGFFVKQLRNMLCVTFFCNVGF